MIARIVKKMLQIIVQDVNYVVPAQMNILLMEKHVVRVYGQRWPGRTLGMSG